MVVLWMISEQKNMQTDSIIQPPPLPYHLQSGNDPCTVDITLTRNIGISSPNGDVMFGPGRDECRLKTCLRVQMDTQDSSWCNYGCLPRGLAC